MYYIYAFKLPQKSVNLLNKMCRQLLENCAATLLDGSDYVFPLACATNCANAQTAHSIILAQVAAINTVANISFQKLKAVKQKLYIDIKLNGSANKVIEDIKQALTKQNIKYLDSKLRLSQLLTDDCVCDLPLTELLKRVTIFNQPNTIDKLWLYEYDSATKQYTEIKHCRFAL